MIIYILLIVLSLTVEILAGQQECFINDHIVQVGYGSGTELPAYSVDGGDLIPLPVPGGYTGFSSRISSDGRVIAAGLLWASYENSVSTNAKGAVWTLTDIVDNIPYYSPPVLLPSLEGTQDNIMIDMSPSGEYLVGACVLGAGPNQYKGVYWDENRNVHGLGSLHYESISYDYSIAQGVRNDKIVFGIAFQDTGGKALAFIWDDQHGMRYLGNVLEQEYGYDCRGLVLTSVEFLDPHGHELYGYAYNSSGEMISWSAIIPEPATIGLLCAGSLFLRRRK